MAEASCIYQHLCYPIEGHLDAVYRIFGYLQNELVRNSWSMTYKSMYEPKYDNVFEVIGRSLYECKYFYPDAQKIIPIHITEALGKYVVIKYYMENNHAGHMVNRR